MGCRKASKLTESMKDLNKITIYKLKSCQASKLPISSSGLRACADFWSSGHIRIHDRLHVNEMNRTCSYIGIRSQAFQLSYYSNGIDSWVLQTRKGLEILAGQKGGSLPLQLALAALPSILLLKSVIE